MKKKNVALIMIGVAEFSGGGGAERFFADFFDTYSEDEMRKRELYFISDNFTNLNKLGKVENKNNTFQIKLYRNKILKRHTEKYRFIRNISNMIRDFPVAISVLNFCKKKNISIIHIPMYEKKDIYLWKWIDVLKPLTKVKIAVNIVDNEIPYRYFSNEPLHRYASYHSYGVLFNHIHVDGFFTWYEKFKTWAEETRIVNKYNFIRPITSRYTAAEVSKNYANKKNVIVFACRLIPVKHPMMYLHAILYLYNLHKEDIRGWKFLIYGKGFMENDIKQFIDEHQLSTIVELGHHPHMPILLEETKCFVSMQDFDNFPSLAMAEAMAKSNAIIAKDVGQTHLFVKNNYNGYLLDEDSVEDLAKKMLKFILISEDERSELCTHSADLIESKHNYKNFVHQIENFWDDVGD